MSCANARRKYVVYINELRMNAADAAITQNRKALQDEAEELKK